MGRIFERDARQRGLPTIYIPLETGRLMPSDLSDEIVLTHPAQPPGSELYKAVGIERSGAATVTTVNGDQPGEDFFHWIQALDVSHDDPVDRDLTLQLEQVVSGNIVRVFRTLGVPAGIPTGLDRVLLVGNGWRPVVVASALAATQVLTLRYMYVAYRIGERYPGG